MYVILMATLSFSGHMNDPQLSAESAIAVIEHQEERIQSWKLEYTSAVRSAKLGSAGKLGEQVASYREVRSGNRYRSMLDLSSNAGRSGPSDLSANSFDGAEYRSHNLTEDRGVISSAGGTDYSYRNYVYMAQRPLSEILKSAAKSEAAWASLNGHRVLRLQTPEAHGAVRTLDLDPTEGWQPRRIVLDQPVPEGAYPDGRKKEIMVMHARAFLHRDEVVIPSDVEILIDVVSPAGRATRNYERNIHLKSVEVNPTIPDSEFTIQFPDGTQVSDKDRDVIYIQGQPGSERPRGARKPPAGPMLQASGAAWNWWADPRIWLGMTAFLLAAVGAVVWRQRRA